MNNFFYWLLLGYCSGWPAGFLIGILYLHNDKQIARAVDYQYFFSRPAVMGILTAMSWLSACVALYDFTRSKIK